MKILFLSFYYHPDLCAGSFRATPLVEALLNVVPLGSEIDVITTQPNRYRSFTAESPPIERHAGLTVLRIDLPKHQSGMLDQSTAFVAFARGALRYASRHHYDIVFATSSRLMTAALGSWIARRQNARLYLDIRDIFVDTIKDVLPGKVAWIVRPLFSRLEKWAVKRADKVNLVSGGFAAYFTARHPQQRFSYFTNGIDDAFVDAAPTRRGARDDLRAGRPLTVLYAGNIGEGQGLHAIVPQLAHRMRSRVCFQIIGDGGRRAALVDALAKLGVTNVELIQPMNREELLARYRAADVLFLHLNDYEAFKKVLPSKLFEYAALGKPIWAGVGGYAAAFVQSEISNAAVFDPCNVEGAVRSFATLVIREDPRAEFTAKYTRAKISQAMASDIVAVASEV